MGTQKEIFGYDIVNFIKCLKSDWVYITTEELTPKVVIVFFFLNVYSYLFGASHVAYPVIIGQGRLNR